MESLFLRQKGFWGSDRMFTRHIDQNFRHDFKDKKLAVSQKNKKQITWIVQSAR